MPITFPNEAPPNLYDNSAISGARKCLRYYYLRYERHWTFENVSMPLHFGSCWHEAMDTVWGNTPDDLNKEELVEAAFESFLDKWVEQMPHPDKMDLQQLTDLKARTPYNAKEMLYAYIESRQHILEDAEVVSIEQPFLVSIGDHYNFIGRLDKVIKFKGQSIIVEHKTTSEYSIQHGFSKSFVDNFNPNSQIDGYMYAGRRYYEKMDYIWVDAALVHKTERRFMFIPFARPFHNEVMWEAETIYWIRRIEEEQNFHSYMKNFLNEAVMTSFPRNTDSCIGKYGACMFRNICSSTLNPAAINEPPAGYKEEKWEPFKTFGLKE